MKLAHLRLIIMMLPLVQPLLAISLPKMQVFADSKLETIRSFAYQLQDITLQSLKDSNFDLVIIDYSSNGTARSEYTAEQIFELRNARNGRKVVSYLSIGEAEDYRFYFKSRWVKRAARRACRVSLTENAPEWLEKPNPEFCGNYKTRFWISNWKKIIFGRASGKNKSYLDRIIDKDFDGVYLDIIDGYEYWMEHTSKSARRKTAARDMARLVVQISHYARVTKGKSKFIVIVQNGSGIISKLTTTMRSMYFNSIDAIGAEDTYYFGDLDQDNQFDPQTQVVANLKQFIASGKVVFSIDYLTDDAKIADFKDRACADGFIPQVSTRSLSSITTHKLIGC